MRGRIRLREPLEFCENGAKAVYEEATTKTVDASFFATHSVAELRRLSDMELGKSGRLTEPMILRPGASHYAPISWDDACALIASELNALPSKDDAIFYTSGRCSNEAAFLYQLFIRMFGTNNLPIARICVMSRRGRDWVQAWVLVKALSVSKIFVKRMRCSSLDKILGPITRECLQRYKSRNARVPKLYPLIH